MKNITNVPLSILRHAFQNMSKSVKAVFGTRNPAFWVGAVMGWHIP